MNTATKTGINASKKLIHNVAEATGEFFENKITDAVTKSYDDKIVKTKPVEEIIILPEKREKNVKRIKINVIKMEHIKISKLLNDSSVLKCVTKKWIELNDLSFGQYSVNKNIRFKTSMLRSDLCDYCHAYIFVKGRRTVE